jgi:deazaflavin-dependent oxidoreductase (nitroreductase family)
MPDIKRGREEMMLTEGADFPDVRWGHQPGPLVLKPLETLVASRFGSWCLRRLRRFDRRLQDRSGGRFTVFGPIGVPLLLLTTTGRKTGQRRRTPLIYMREGEHLYIIGTNFGQSMHPEWSANLLADPHAWVTMGGKEIPVTALALHGAQSDRVCAMFERYNTKVYRSYRARTDRELRVFMLSRR